MLKTEPGLDICSHENCYTYTFTQVNTFITSEKFSKLPCFLLGNQQNIILCVIDSVMLFFFVINQLTHHLFCINSNILWEQNNTYEATFYEEESGFEITCSGDQYLTYFRYI